ncbi:MAG: SDR family NAD(P)-dependent oxidoreductase [Desulfobulbaceae bacterium]|nr:MAG: SDR family NAD(P)-dependent oxidoreductase [Desulfobulbaceae bacterium]
MSAHKSHTNLYFTSSIAGLETFDVTVLQEKQIAPIIDLTQLNDSEFSDFCRNAPAEHLLLNVHQFIDNRFHQPLRNKRIGTIWLEYFEHHPAGSFSQIIEALRQVESIRLTIITGDLSIINLVYGENRRDLNLAIKGAESVGFVSSESTLSLLNYIEDRSQSNHQQPDIVCWGGCFTAEGAASLLLGHCDGVVLDSVHLLTSAFTKKNSLQRTVLEKCQIDHISQIHLSRQLKFNCYNKGNSERISALKVQLAQETGEISSDLLRTLLNDFGTFTQTRFVKSELQCGVEVAYCNQFIHQFGFDTTEALISFKSGIDILLSNKNHGLTNLINSPLTPLLGTTYPIIQGAMACISDNVEFARAISDAGGLPTIALGMQSRIELEQNLLNLPLAMNGKPYGINIITLDENPYRDEQLDWIKEARPPFVVISAGTPYFAAELKNQGMQVIYITSDPGLLEIAWNKGIDLVVLEGNEAGGHVGLHTTLTLGQAAQILRQQHNDFAGKYIILAGGIFNQKSLRRSGMLGADGVQMGTIYLSSREIVETGAMSQVYQQVVLDARFGQTMITGNSIGLMVRSIDSPKLKIIRDLENNISSQSTSEDTARHQLEKTSAGSLYIAAKCNEPLTGNQLLDEICYQEGQFMGGAVSGNIRHTTSLTDLHQSLFSTIEQEPQLPNSHVHVSESESHDRIAVTGLSIANALGNSVETVWNASVSGKSGITEVPESRWDHDQFYSESENQNGKTYCRVGAFMSLDISRKDLGISPHDFRTMTASTRLTLWLADQAITQSAIINSDVSREKIGVFVSQNAGESGSTIPDLTINVIAHNLAQQLQKGLSLNSDSVNTITEIIKQDRIAIDDTTLLGRLNCAAGGFICNKYGFMGPSYAVSAACATGLVALYNGIQLIQANILDAAVVGGGEEILNPAAYLEFSALGALAGKNRYGMDPSDYSMPFSKDRSGMVLGEGGGMLVIERESIARARGAKILAYITGAGASNNHQGMVESVAETQQLAINSSFAQAGYGPDSVDLVECHATSTPTGDLEEIKALKAVYPMNNGTALSSFKSQIGHTLGAAGINSMIRGIAAMHARTLPPTLNYQDKDPAIDLEGWGFHVPTSAQPWPGSTGHPRRFQVNAFGFGGANYVIQLEEADENYQKSDMQVSSNPTDQTHLPSLIDGVYLYEAHRGESHYQIATTQRSVEQLKDYLTPHLDHLSDLAPKARISLARHGIHLGDNHVPRLALIFAGQGSQYQSMGKALYDSFPAIRSWMDRMAQLADFDILDVMFNSTDDKLRQTQFQQPALFVLEYALYQQLAAFGLKPTALAGHSMGELTALCAAGSFSVEDGFNVITKRAQCMARASRETADPGSMIAVDVPRDILDEMIELDQHLYYTNFNSPQQIVVGGSSVAIERFKEELDNRSYWNQPLPVSMAFHSPIMEIIRDEFGEYLRKIDIKPPSIPVLSNTSGIVYPDDSEAITETLVAHLESPVHWQENVQSLAQDFGCDLFVEIGPQDTLCKLVNDIIPDVERIHCCSRESELDSFRQAYSALYVRNCLSISENIQNLSLDTPVEQPKSKPTDGEIAHVIQREITGYALDGMNKFLIPAIQKALAHELDYQISEELLRAQLGVASQQTISTLVTQPHKMVAHPPDIASDQRSILEEVIQIIMDTTGYERSEIEPEMDIRQDLSIRSSRLPVIMDAAEKRFDIVIRIEDFIDVRTIYDMSARIEEVIARGEVTDPSLEARQPPTHPPANQSQSPVSRFVPHLIKLEPARSSSPLFTDTDHLGVISIESAETAMTLSMQLPRLYGCRVSIETLGSDQLPEKPLFADHEDLSSLILLTSDQTAVETVESEHVSLMTNLFLQIQQFLTLGRKKSIIHLNHVNSKENQIIPEGLIGTLLSTSIEYPSVTCRSISYQEMSVVQAIEAAGNPSFTTVELVEQDQQFYTVSTATRPTTHIPQLAAFNNQTTVVITGGLGGVGKHIAQRFESLGCALILIGRKTVAQAQEIITDSFSSSSSISYIQCDLGNPEELRGLDERCPELKSATILIHAAGFISDSFIGLQTAEGFSDPISVKYSGLAGLLEAIEAENLFAICSLSSQAAFTGNIGQANYCCGNRMMAALLHSLANQYPEKTVKNFWLPPIAGAGMAEDPQVKDLIEANIGADSYVCVTEIAEIIIHEITSGERESIDVMPLRSVLNFPTISHNADPIVHGWFSTDTCPLVDRIESLNFEAGEILTVKTLSQQSDPWILDHQPFSFLKDPIFSAIMVLESFLESTHLMMPQIVVNGFTDVRFLDMISCPPETDVGIEVHCIRDAKESFLQCILSRTDGSEQDQGTLKDICYTGTLHLSPLPIPDKHYQFEAVDFSADYVSSDKMDEQYISFCELSGRYRVLQKISDCDEKFISGIMRTPDCKDHDATQNSQYQYPLYILEGLMQLCAFHPGFQEHEKNTILIPASLDSVQWFTTNQPLTRYHLIAHRVINNRDRSKWNGTAYDDKGNVVMEITGLRLHSIAD